MEFRIELYNTTFGAKYPGSYIHRSGRWNSAIWMLGNNYKGSGFYGAYPPSYLCRIMSLFDGNGRILHAFSGSLEPGNYTRVDVNPSSNPDIVSTIENMPLMDNTFDLVIADPPYSPADAEKYGYQYPNKRLCLREIHRILISNGYLVWLDTRMPMYRKDMFLPICLIGIIRSTNHRVRLCTIFRRI